VPRSRIRRRADFTPPTAKTVKVPGTAGRLVGPIALILLLLGLAWIVVFYLAGADVPVMSSLGNWNLAIGMGLITAGFITLTRWK
jgi:Cell division protein CrgA